MNRTDVRCVEISSFDGLDEIKTSVYATDKTINTIAKGKNFIIKDGILEVSRSPKTMNISIPAADKVNNTVADKFVVNGFGKFYWSEKKYYEGQGLNNKQHGKGLIRNDDKEIEGIFRFGKIIKGQ